MSRRWSDSSAQSMAYWCIMSTQSKRVEVSDLGFRMGMSIVFVPSARCLCSLFVSFNQARTDVIKMEIWYGGSYLQGLGLGFGVPKP